MADNGALPERTRYGNYEVIEEVGEGATSVVYKARHYEDGSIVALKVMRLDPRKTKMARRLKKLFMTEAALATQVQHPNIVQIYSAQMEDDCAFLAMEFVEGQPLREYCTFDKLLPPHRVVEIMFKCAMAIDYSGRRGIVHRDIKPDNILLSNDDEVKVMDFGLALNLRKSGSDSTFIMGVGSPAYMSPEQIKDYPLNTQSDVYSLGAVMFELLTGRLPFRAKNRGALMYKIINMDPEPVSTLNPAVPEELDSIVKKSLEKDLFTRYRNGIELAQDLSGAKFQILDDADSVKLSQRFKTVRVCPAFLEFENDEIWEILRISFWRQYNELRQFITEGDEGATFGVLLEGKVEIQMGGRQLALLGPGEVIGELAFFNPGKGIRTTSAVALTDIVYLEVSAAAYALASEECQEHFRKLVVDTLIKRISAMNAQLIAQAPKATAGIQESDLGLSLMPIDGEAPPVPMSPAAPTRRIPDETTATSIILTSGGDVVVIEDDVVGSRHIARAFDKR